jgi:hypothetical protein
MPLVPGATPPAVQSPGPLNPYAQIGRPQQSVHPMIQALQQWLQSRQQMGMGKPATPNPVPQMNPSQSMARPQMPGQTGFMNPFGQQQNKQANPYING